jgi:hypothetical protein
LAELPGSILPQVATDNRSAFEEVFKLCFLETWDIFVAKPEVLEPQGELKMITLPSCYYFLRGK